MGDQPIGRRALIRRAAIVGGLAWTAPVILQSMASPAGAVTDVPSNGTTTTSNSTVPTTAPAVSGIAPMPVFAPPTFTS